MKRFLTGWLLITLTQLALADTPENYRHLMPLLPQHEGGQHRLVLPAEIYLNAEQPNLTDLRLFNASRESLPFAFSSEPADPPPKPAQQALNWFALPDSEKIGEDVHLTVNLQPDGTLTASRNQSPPVSARIKRYLIDASQLKQAAQALEIEADDTHGALHHLTLEASDDLKYWRTLADHAPWLDLHSDSGQLTFKRVEFAPTRSKYFRLTWNDFPAPIRQVSAEITADNAPAQSLKHVLQIGQHKSGSADYEFEMPPALCLERLRLILPQADSIASVSFFARRSEQESWQSVTAATFYRINRDNSEITAPAHAMQGLRARYWRLHLDRYSTELPATLQLEIGWRPHQLVFLASGSAPYTLAFGNHTAKSASFPLATLLPGYRAGDELKLPVAAIGALVSRPREDASFMEKFHNREWKPLLLWVVLIIGVALLGWMAWSIKKELNRRIQL